MEYALLDDDARKEIRSRHLLDLEATHYRLTLEEVEEPGTNPDRTRMLAEIERRAGGHRAALGLDERESEESDENVSESTGTT